jgi:predicted O-methyltransferase YrrM
MTEGLTYQDRMLSVQREQSHLFEGDASALTKEIYQTIASVCGLRSPHEELDLELTPLHRIEEMASAPLNLRFLQSIVMMTGARRVIEIGAFIGVSATYLAKVLPEDGKLVTIEKFDQFAEICRHNFHANGVADRIHLIQGDAFAVLSSLAEEEPFDFALIDGDKGRYRQYFEMIDPLMRPGGVICVDDVFFHGDALNDQPQTDKGRGVKSFLEALQGRRDYMSTILPIGNGVALAIKNT